MIGSHVDVHWTDGLRYGGTIVGEQNGYLLVRWDGGAQTAWVAPNQLVPAAAPAAPQPPAAWPQAPVQQQQWPQAAPQQQAAWPQAQPQQEQWPQAATKQPEQAQQQPQAPPQQWPQPAQQQQWPQAAQQQWPQAAQQQQQWPQAAQQQWPQAPAAAQPQWPQGTAAPAQPPWAGQGSVAGAPALPQPARVLPSRDGGPAHAMVFEPTAQGSGNGKSFFMFFGYKSSSERDRRMRAREIEHLGDDVAALRAAGYRVVVDLNGEREVLDAALVGRHPESGGTQTAGVLWSGHGSENGAIEAHTGDEILPMHLSRDILSNSALRLFVMSACHTGKHTEAWRAALGSQVSVIGWGAPITLERAVDFFTPDEASGKDFDDLLRSLLGVQRVADDGPLVEIQALAEALTSYVVAAAASAAQAASVPEDDSEVPNMRYEELVAAAAERIGAHVKDDERNRYLTVSCTPPEGGPTGRTQLVRIFPNGDDDWLIYVISRAGIYSEAIDMVRAIRGISNVRYTRIYLAPKDDNGQERITAEAGVIRVGMDPERLAYIIQEVADTADHMEYMFFGSDDR